jgi:siroheme synthase (precorrin-2 oxidase/ferrochelatase)
MGIGGSFMLANEIRDQIASYLSNKISLEQFENWIAQHTWNIHRFGDPAVEQRAFQIEAKLAEYSAGHIDEAALRQELAAMLPSHTPRSPALMGN